jgi:hypothetical protein
MWDRHGLPWVKSLISVLFRHSKNTIHCFVSLRCAIHPNLSDPDRLNGTVQAMLGFVAAMPSAFSKAF